LPGQHFARTRQAIPASGIAAMALLCSIGATQAQTGCAQSPGDYVVIEVKWDDPIGGLAIRTGPDGNSERRGVIPSSGVGVAVGECVQSGWCEVSYQCIAGWSLSARYLAPRFRRLYRVSGVSAADPEGLNVRSGPHNTYAPKGRIPYDGANVIVHVCQPSPLDGTDWCLVTYGQNSGWAAGRYLTPIPASSPSPSPSPPPTPSPGPSSVPLNPTSPACQKYPNLC
jgi:uncharacterized protein YraI